VKEQNMASSFIDELIASGFSRFSGLNISGTVPLQQDLINEALGELVQSWSRPQEAEKPGLPLAQLLPIVRKVQVRAEPGVVNVDFEIGV
jgi:hypothetical protein